MKTKKEELTGIYSMLKRGCTVTLKHRKDVYVVYTKILERKKFYGLHRNKKLIVLSTNLMYIKRVLPEKIEFYMAEADGVLTNEQLNLYN